MCVVAKRTPMLKHLNLDEMVGLTSPWVSDASIESLFLSIPEIAALHPQVVELQASLGEARPLGASRSKAMQAIIDEAAKVDVVHDALVRAVESGVESDRLCSLARKPRTMRVWSEPSRSTARGLDPADVARARQPRAVEGQAGGDRDDPRPGARGVGAGGEALRSTGCDRECGGGGRRRNARGGHRPGAGGRAMVAPPFRCRIRA
jgi:hypothetical protein